MGNVPCARHIHTLLPAGSDTTQQNLCLADPTWTEGRCSDGSKKFTDHRAVMFVIAFEVPLTLRGRGYWKTNTTLLQERTFQEKLRLQWERCVRQGTFYSDSHVVRAEANAPPLLGRRDGSKAGKNGHVKLLQCVFVRRSAKHQPQGRKCVHVKPTEGQNCQTAQYENAARNDQHKQPRHDKVPPSLLLKMRKRWEQRTTNSMINPDGCTQTSINSIVHKFSAFLRR